MLARRLSAGVLTACALAGAAITVFAPAGAAIRSSVSDPSVLYRAALATTRSWSVHYASTSTQSGSTLVVSGDAGPASGSQTVTMGTGTISILVIGGITYVKGNPVGLEKLVGFSASEAAPIAGQWIDFPTDDATFASVVVGVRSADVAKELALKGPLTLGRARTVDGVAADAIEGTQTFGHKTVHVVLYVRARGSHVPVEEDSLDVQGQPTSAEHVVYASWGEVVRPQAPQATVTLGPISST
ncbi:MAG TPA: hypothetical protein VEH82_07370 [Acidimicrobiales bacterium]|nr:hypothetical protein [Acidimicrobiales bacterium]